MRSKTLQIHLSTRTISTPTGLKMSVLNLQVLLLLPTLRRVNTKHLSLELFLTGPPVLTGLMLVMSPPLRIKDNVAPAGLSLPPVLSNPLIT